MMAQFEFGGESLTVNKKMKSPSAISVELYSKSTGDGHVLVLLDSVPTPDVLRALPIHLSKVFSSMKFDVVALTSAKISQEDIAKYGVLKFFKDNRKDVFKSYIIPGETVIVTMGRAIIGLNLASDINIDGFYDNILGKSYYYSQDTACYVFPVDHFEDIFKKNPSTGSWQIQDSFRSVFAASQFSYIINNYPNLKNPPLPTRPTIIRLPTAEVISKFFMNHKLPEMVSWDIETTGFDFMEDKVICMTISFDGKTGYFLPWDLINKDELNEFLDNKIQLGQNLKFDCKFLRQNGVPNARIDEDTLIMGQIIGEGRANSLKALAYYYTPYGGYDRELDEYVDKYAPSNYGEIPDKILSTYATMDAIVTRLTYTGMKAQLENIDKENPPEEKGAYTLYQYYKQIRLPAVNAFIDIEMGGVYVDMKRWDINSNLALQNLNNLAKEIGKELEIDKYIGTPEYTLAVSFGVEEDEEDSCNIYSNPYFKIINSPAKLGKLLKWAGWSEQGLSLSGDYLTGDDQLLRWDKGGRHAASRLRIFRSYRTLLKTFLGAPGTKEGWRKYIRQHPDGSYRIHPTYRVMGAESGRCTCDSPNWQQIPSGSIGAELVKQIISVPDPNEYYLATLDYSSLQVRLAAIDSQDEYLTRIYREDPDADLHSVTAYEVFCRGREFEVEEITVTDNGVTKTFFAHEKVQIKREGQCITVVAANLQQGDSLVLDK